MNPVGATVSPITEGEFFNAARVTTFLLVEGTSDQRFWSARIDRFRCQVRAMGGRSAALEELEVAEKEGKIGYVAVLDVDFDRMDGQVLNKENVVWTDLHDLEAILIAAPALEKVLTEVGSAQKIQKFENDEKRSLRDALLARAAPLGKLRWISKHRELQLTFRKAANDGQFRYVDYQAFCSRNYWALDEAKMFRKVADFSERHGLAIGELLELVKTVPECDLWQLCVGHDLVGLLVVGLHTRLGSRHLQMDDLAEKLRLAFEREDLHRTQMFKSLLAWEERNEPFQIFPRYPV